MDNILILVNSEDEKLGYGEKMLTHRNGWLHRAYSVFIYCKDEKKFLIQKRHKEKYHSGEKWSNSFCSHPYKGESWFESLQRGAYDELNLSLDISCDLKCNSKMKSQFLCDNLFYAGSFIYHSDYEGMYEHELDNVFVYEIESIINDISFNTLEVSDVRWLNINEIENWIGNTPTDFSTWFERALNLVKENYIQLWRF